jgi:hypothetical protein
VEGELPPELRPEAVLSRPMTASAPTVEASPDSSSGTVSAPPSFRDRGTGLMIFGVFQIILGLLAALMVPLATLGAFLSRVGPGGGLRPGQWTSSILTYALIAAGLITLGCGSIQMKRWARALTLVISWYWLIMGALVTALLTAVLPVAMGSAVAQAQRNAGTPGPELPAGVMAVVLTLIIVFSAFFLIVVPIAFVVFYGRKDVAETVRHRDPVERWTDRTPLPVLGASVVFLTGSLYLLVIAVTTPLFPFFGRYLHGVAGATALIALAALDIYLAVAMFRLKPLGWRIAIVTVPIRLFSMALTYARADLMQAYSKMGWSGKQLEMLNANPMLRGHVILWWSLLSLFIFFGYLLWLRRYFNVPAAPRPAFQVSDSLG